MDSRLPGFNPRRRAVQERLGLCKGIVLTALNRS
jgi:hypothetical protein